MMPLSRRVFLKSVPGVALSLNALTSTQAKAIIMTVRGAIEPLAAGSTLIHEHILVDFIGAKHITPERWDRDAVSDKVLPYLDELKKSGCQTLVDCTPNYLGRDPELLKSLSSLSGLNIITNTGYYGGSDPKFLPEHAFTETAQQLAGRWINEWRKGIDTSGVKPGFIKISVNPEQLSEISQKLIKAAALTHLQSGLTIASHTGPWISAAEQIEIVKKSGVHPNAFIWVHAQQEKDRMNYVKAANEGAWISLDGLNDENILEYVGHINFAREQRCLDRILVSHDAGWYDPGKPGGGEFKPFTTMFRKLIPLLKENNFKNEEIDQILKMNPRNAFTISLKRLKK